MLTSTQTLKLGASADKSRIGTTAYSFEFEFRTLTDAVLWDVTVPVSPSSAITAFSPTQEQAFSLEGNVPVRWRSRVVTATAVGPWSVTLEFTPERKVLSLSLSTPIDVTAPVKLTAPKVEQLGFVSDCQAPVWSTDDPAVASISSDGLLTPLAPGDVNITIKCGHVSATRVAGIAEVWRGSFTVTSCDRTPSSVTSCWNGLDPGTTHAIVLDIIGDGGRVNLSSSPSFSQFPSIPVAGVFPNHGGQLHVQGSQTDLPDCGSHIGAVLDVDATSGQMTLKVRLFMCSLTDAPWRTFTVTGSIDLHR